MHTSPIVLHCPVLSCIVRSSLDSGQTWQVVRPGKWSDLASEDGSKDGDRLNKTSQLADHSRSSKADSAKQANIGISNVPLQHNTTQSYITKLETAVNDWYFVAKF